MISNANLCRLLTISILALSNVEVCDRKREEGTPRISAATRPSIPEHNSWVIKLEKQIQLVETESTKLASAQKQLDDLGPAPPENSPDRNKYEIDAFQFMRVWRDDRRALKRALIQLWFISGHAERILQIDPIELPERAPEVVSAYKTWLKQHRADEIEVMARVSLKENVEAVKTKYCWAAFQIIQHWVCVEVDLDVFHENPTDKILLVRTFFLS